MTLPAIMTGAARVTQPPSRLPAELDPRGPGRSRPTRGSTGTRARPGIARWLRWTAGGSALAVALVLVGGFAAYQYYSCLLYTSDAADDLLCVDLGGRRI